MSYLRPYKFPPEKRAEIVTWWRKYVSCNHGGDRQSAQRMRSEMPVELAERLCGVTQVTISRWKRELEKSHVAS